MPSKSQGDPEAADVPRSDPRQDGEYNITGQASPLIPIRVSTGGEISNWNKRSAPGHAEQLPED